MKHFKNILYLNEPTVDQASAFARAVWLAENNQADLTIIDVIPTQVVTAGFGLPPGGADIQRSASRRGIRSSQGDGIHD